MNSIRPAILHASDTAPILELDMPAAPTVMIVDDDAQALARLQEIVTAAGYTVRTAASGVEALRLLERSSTSIVMTDLEMPAMGGLELCRRIREYVWPGYVYTVLLTVGDGEKDIQAGRDAGADDYLSKRASAAQCIARLRIAKRVLALEYSLRSALEKRRKLATTDALTGVYNSRYFVRHLGRELRRSQQFGGDVSLLLINVIHFERLNGKYEHGIGDIVLKNLTEQIASCLLRSTDWCARLGEGEFAVVLAGTTLAEARTRAEKVRELVADTCLDASAGPVRVRISIGVSGTEEIVDSNLVTVQSMMDHANGYDRVTLSNLNAPHMGAQEPADRSPKHVNSRVSISSIR